MAVLGLYCCTGFSPVSESWATPPLWCEGFSVLWLLLSQSMGSGAHGLQQLWRTGSGLRFRGSRAQAQ